MAQKLTAQDIAAQTQHWLGTPVNGYLGSSYGAPRPDLVHQPQAAGVADGFIAKCRRDVPATAALGGRINLYAENTGPDRQRILMELGDTQIEVGSA